jgi:hypothetical protein
MRLALPVMLQRLLAHRQLRAGHKLAVRAEDVIVAKLMQGADRPRHLHVPRMSLYRANQLLQHEVPALQTYLLVSFMHIMPGWRCVGPLCMCNEFA